MIRAAIGLLLLSGVALADTEIFDAKLIKLDPKESEAVVQKRGGPEQTAPLGKSAKLWADKKPVTQEDFKKQIGKTVRVRMSVRTNAGDHIREMADLETAKWLDAIRRGEHKATLESIEDETVEVKFPDGAKFTYRFGDKTAITKQGKPATMEEFEKGDLVHVSPRLLSNLETTLLKISDAAQAAAVAKPTAERGLLKGVDQTGKRLRFAPAGKADALIAFDQSTLFLLSGKTIQPKDVAVPVEASIEKKGEIAAKVILYSPSGAEAAMAPAIPTVAPKEPFTPTVAGLLKSIDERWRTLVFVTKNGSEIEVEYDDGSKFLIKGKETPVTEIIPPVEATLYRKKGKSGKDLMTRMILYPEGREPAKVPAKKPVQ